jgi:3-phosphoshikimate 1-carboxyvinyltransferase
MGAEVRFHLHTDRYEPVGDIVVRGRGLKGVKVSERIPWVIDELPALAIAMAVAEGESEVRNAGELRVKESDRINGVVSNLKKFGIEVEELPDGFRIKGGEPKGGVVVESGGDHRIAMSFAILGTITGEVVIEEAESIYTSFPSFFNLFKQVAHFELEGGNSEN